MWQFTTSQTESQHDRYSLSSNYFDKIYKKTKAFNLANINNTYYDVHDLLTEQFQY